jgi:4-hydroxy-2-oxoheptanedioate aldolase
MDGLALRQALHDGRRVYGTLVVSDSPLWPRAIAGSGLDFVFIDTEHTALTRTQVAWMCQMYGAIGIAPIVRLSSPDVNAAANLIDTGAAGIIAPYVESPDVVRALAGAVRLRPLKGRRRDEALSGTKLEPKLDEYLHGRNDGHSLIVNIESVPAMENLDEILAIPGLDAVLIGPHDLSCSLGVPEEYDHPNFMAAVETIFTKARSNNVGAGMHYTGEVEKQVDFLKLGANMLIHCADVSLFATHLKRDLASIRSAIGDAASVSHSGGPEEHI